MDIQLSFDSSTSLAPAGFVTAMDYAASQLDALITDPVTVSIEVSWNNAVFGEGGANMTAFSYAGVVAALKAHASTPAGIEAAANLPAVDPTGTGYLKLTDAQAEALGLMTGSAGPGQDGFVIFGSAGALLDFSTTGTSVPSNQYDFVGVAEHELTHALGRIDANSGAPQFIMDLYKYAAPGTLQTNGTNLTYISIDGGATALDTLSTISDLSDWAGSAGNDAFTAYANQGVLNTISSADTALMSALGFNVLCFAAGTRIATPEGEAAVESLAIGDEVLSLFKGRQRVKWIGVSHYDGRFLTGNHLMLPVCINAGALGDGVPERALWVSPGHGILAGDGLVPAWRLVNGVSVTQAQSVERVSYYHIELAAHDVVFAQNCPAESYLDIGERRKFHNAAGFEALYPGEQAAPVACMARLEDGFGLRDAQAAVNARAGIAPVAELAGALRGALEVAGPEVVAGWALCPACPEVPVELLVFAGAEVVARVLANGYRADVRAAGLGSGCCGFAVAIPAGVRGAVSVRRALDGAEVGFVGEVARVA
ncbi:NF038122 family metalloprotease [Acidocella sp.]|uniref:NF038122 family metalloprotease n=1 Tax=Acidocella sp. TaxID=50710 RepID=UPI0026384616|nr:NF038122 family metalloprotease [Acidocella sp.]MDD2795921.1 NF038122 family metalloprotease [Acidocella sp.]